METDQTQNKHHKNNTIHENGNVEALIPGIPDDLARLCLSKSLPPSLLFSVCHSWRRLLHSPTFLPCFSLYALLSPTHRRRQANDYSTCNNTGIEFYTFEPMSSTWHPLPPPPTNPPLSLLHRHPSFLSRNLPIQSVAVSNHLVLVAATTHRFAPALSSPLIFHPESGRWFYGPPLSTPRRWCAAGSARGAVYVASGVGSLYHADVARSMQRWTIASCTDHDNHWRWENKAELKDGRFSRDAVEAIGYKGKLCMVNVKGSAIKEGAVYDVDSNKWEGMPSGMLAGWNGPAASWMDGEDELYVVDEGRGALRKYDDRRDGWEVVVELPELRKAEQLAAGRGKVCVVCGDGERVLVVDVVAMPVKVWAVAPPRGLQVVAVHILPRIRRE